MRTTKNIPKIVITELGRWDYFEWFILGFYLLNRQGLIGLKFQIPLVYRLLFVFSNSFITRVVAKFIRFFYGVGSYNLKGYIEYNEKRREFTIDCADSPFSFDGKILMESSIYFKMQCPKKLDDDFFPLLKSILLPWIDHSQSAKKNQEIFKKVFLENRYKIKPLMVGPRRLGYGLSFKELNKGYQNIVSARKLNKIQRFMCYFGNSQGPVATNSKLGEVDLNSESQLMGFLGERASHPNEKRFLIADILKGFNGSDARVINLGNSDSRCSRQVSAPISLENFCSHIANFEYNFNVSGYRLSVPNRFIESFSVGTAIVTDKLALQWYQPFSVYEVIETVDMGYEKMKDVDFNKFKYLVRNLPRSSPEEIVNDFERKWHPLQVAKYIVRSTINDSSQLFGMD